MVSEFNIDYLYEDNYSREKFIKEYLNSKEETQLFKQVLLNPQFFEYVKISEDDVYIYFFDDILKSLTNKEKIDFLINYLDVVLNDHFIFLKNNVIRGDYPKQSLRTYKNDFINILISNVLNKFSIPLTNFLEQASKFKNYLDVCYLYLYSYESKEELEPFFNNYILNNNFIYLKNAKNKENYFNANPTYTPLMSKSSILSLGYIKLPITSTFTIYLNHYSNKSFFEKLELLIDFLKKQIEYTINNDIDENLRENTTIVYLNDLKINFVNYPKKFLFKKLLPISHNYFYNKNYSYYIIKDNLKYLFDFSNKYSQCGIEFIGISNKIKFRKILELDSRLQYKKLVYFYLKDNKLLTFSLLKNKKVRLSKKEESVFSSFIR